MTNRINLDEYEHLLQGLDMSNLSSVCQAWLLIYNHYSKLSLLEQNLRQTAGTLLKTRGWDNYTDPKTQVHVSVTHDRVDHVDMKALRKVIPYEQLIHFLKFSTVEKVLMTTPDQRVNLKEKLKVKQ